MKVGFINLYNLTFRNSYSVRASLMVKILEAQGIPWSELSRNAVFIHVPLNTNAVLQSRWNDWLQTSFSSHLVSPQDISNGASKMTTMIYAEMSWDIVKNIMIRMKMWRYDLIWSVLTWLLMLQFVTFLVKKHVEIDLAHKNVKLFSLPYFATKSSSE